MAAPQTPDRALLAYAFSSSDALTSSPRAIRSRVLTVMFACPDSIRDIRAASSPHASALRSSVHPCARRAARIAEPSA